MTNYNKKKKEGIQMKATYRVEKTSETNHKTIIIAEDITSRREAEDIAGLFGGEVIAVFDPTELMNGLLSR